MSGTGGGGGIILARVNSGPDQSIHEHAWRQMLQAIRYSHPDLYAALVASTVPGDPVP
jgi:hypothetical protein